MSFKSMRCHRHNERREKVWTFEVVRNLQGNLFLLSSSWISFLPPDTAAEWEAKRWKGAIWFSSLRVMLKHKEKGSWRCLSGAVLSFGSVTEDEILNGTKFLKRIETDIIELLHFGANESGECVARICGEAEWKMNQWCKDEWFVSWQTLECRKLENRLVCR